MRGGQRFAVELGATFGVAISKNVTVLRRVDFGVQASDVRIAEKTDLDMFVEAESRLTVDEQINMPFLSPAQDLNPGASEGLFHQGQTKTQARAEDDHAETLAQIVAVAQTVAKSFKKKSADESADSAADETEPEALKRAVGDALTNADAETQDRPRDRAAERSSLQTAEDDFADDEADRTSRRACDRAPRTHPRQAKPSTVPKRLGGVKEEADGRADRHSGENVAHPPKFGGLDQFLRTSGELDVEKQAADRADRARDRQIIRPPQARSMSERHGFLHIPSFVHE